MFRKSSSLLKHFGLIGAASVAALVCGQAMADTGYATRGGPGYAAPGVQQVDPIEHAHFASATSGDSAVVLSRAGFEYTPQPFHRQDVSVARSDSVDGSTGIQPWQISRAGVEYVPPKAGAPMPAANSGPADELVADHFSPPNGNRAGVALATDRGDMYAQDHHAFSPTRMN
ncbi:MAG: hypothetical protein GC151_19835 [Betaproteobacteria bacterium]|nr:hypothetical protein [Betaproteobacteria bacterium]